MSSQIRDKNVTSQMRALKRIRRKTKIVGDCYEYQGTLHNSGYGMICLDGKQLRVHRLIYEIVNGPIPEGKIICHTCDNRRCCNPEHLVAADHDWNAADRNAKGRQAKGERHGRYRHGKRVRPDNISDVMDEWRRQELLAAVDARRAEYQRAKAARQTADRMPQETGV